LAHNPAIWPATVATAAGTVEVNFNNLAVDVVAGTNVPFVLVTETPIPFFAFTPK
jgi:hypothetical protein